MVILSVFLAIFCTCVSAQVPTHVPVWSDAQVSNMSSAFAKFNSSNNFCPQANGIVTVQPFQSCNAAVQAGNSGCLDFASQQTAGLTTSLSSIGAAAPGAGAVALNQANVASQTGNTLSQTTLSGITTACTTATSTCASACQQAVTAYQANTAKIQGVACQSSFAVQPNSPQYATVIQEQASIKTTLIEDNANLLKKSQGLLAACQGTFGTATTQAQAGTIGMTKAVAGNMNLGQTVAGAGLGSIGSLTNAATSSGSATTTSAAGAPASTTGDTAGTSTTNSGIATTSTSTSTSSACPGAYVDTASFQSTGSLPALTSCQTSQASTYCANGAHSTCLSCQALSGGAPLTSQGILQAQVQCPDDPIYNQSSQYGALLSGVAPSTTAVHVTPPARRNTIIGSQF
jgi:hypothetical protein